ncbi:hypothetical protein AAE02nite_18150 [Adhaeribacter aerolatus]|uniref:HTH luxR-type domain-containing protein n=1 Tax=Adhaeribacter aerolatus TaxID=670289 RepID=A0A512AWQ4_9BACT|nr:helix-turn-helix transcriptional regulator [Adhaeribacter aerolatus]GEO04151.1 hypothetical protein AAE02nite_18150 [Adhaeribacter aerolatus]
MEQIYPSKEALATPKYLNVSTQLSLTKRETEILKLITDEYSSLEIAETLSISLKTVDTHRKSLIRKTGARNIVGLVKFALHFSIAKW